jgi:hypothetical protein
LLASLAGRIYDHAPQQNAFPLGRHNMRTLGQILMGVGALLGIAVGIGVALPIPMVGVTWLVAVGLVKLTFVAALGLMASGATLLRIAHRSESKLLESDRRAP